jgi:hypothetical protein
LYLVDPLGGRYIVTSLPAVGGAVDDELSDWSGDKQRALVTYYLNEGGSLVVQLGLATGKVLNQLKLGTAQYPWSTNLHFSYPIVQYTRPAGGALLLGPAPSTLYRASLDGTRQAGFPKQFPVVGQNRGQALYFPDGDDLVVGATNGMAVLSNNGQFLRPLRSPTGLWCTPERWWKAGMVLASCLKHEKTAGPLANFDFATLWVVPTSGSPATALASPPQVLDDYDAWELTSGVYVQEYSPACIGAYYLAKVQADLSTAEVDVPGPKGTGVNVVGAYKSQVELLTVWSACLPEAGAGPPISLFWFDPVTKAVTVLVGPSARSAAGVDVTVTSALLYNDGFSASTKGG